MHDRIWLVFRTLRVDAYGLFLSAEAPDRKVMERYLHLQENLRSFQRRFNSHYEVMKREAIYVTCNHIEPLE